MNELQNNTGEDFFIGYLKRYVFVLESYITNGVEEYYSLKHKNDIVTRPLDRARKKSIEQEISRVNAIIWSHKKFTEEL